MNNDNNIFDQYAELVRKFKSGDESAFTDIYENSKKLVYTTCLGILNNEQDAEDAMQETYLTVYEKIGTLDAENTFVTWLKTIAANKARDKFKAKKNDASYDDILATEDYTEGDDNLENLPDSIILEKDKRDTFYKILRKALSDEQFQTTLLYYYDELPVAQIAKIMECPENTVKSKLRLARVKIKAGIEDYEKKNNISLLGAIGTGSLGTFFNAYYNTARIPTIHGLPIKLGTNANGASGKAAAKAATKTGNLAKNAGAASGTGTKAGVLASPVAKIGIALAAVAVIAVPTAIIVNNVKKEDVKVVYEIQYDGLYCNINEDEKNNDIIRFYDDGNLIYTSYDYDNDDERFPTGSWFNLDSDDDRVEKGTYEVDKGKIEITIEQNPENKTYKGELSKDVIILKGGEEYKFYKFDDIDGYEYIYSDMTDTSEDDLDSKVKEAYLKTVVRHENGIRAHENLPQDMLAHDDPIPSINYIDLNKDGIYEMILALYEPLGDDDSKMECQVAVYTYDQTTETAKAMYCAYTSFTSEAVDCNGPKLSELLWVNNEYFLYCSHLYDERFGYEEHICEFRNGEKGFLNSYDNCDKWSVHWNESNGLDPQFHPGHDKNYRSMSNDEYFAALEHYYELGAVPVYPSESRFLNNDYSFDTDDVFGSYDSYNPEDSFSVFDSVYAMGNYYLYDDFVAFLKGEIPGPTVSVTEPVVTSVPEETAEATETETTLETTDVTVGKAYHVIVFSSGVDGDGYSYSKFDNEYDANDRLIKSTNLASGHGDYYEFSNGEFQEYMDEIKSQEGSVLSWVEYEYGNSDNLIKETNFNESGNISRYTEYEYDKSDKLIKKTDFKSDGSITGYTGYEYDSSNNLIRKNNYDADGNVKSYIEYEYDSKNNMIKECNYSSNNNLSYYFEYEYDDSNNMIKQTRYSSDGNVNYYTDYEYNSSNNLEKSIKHSGGTLVTTDYYYDENDNLISVKMKGEMGFSNKSYEYIYD